jgi:signal transduction histidine kinase
MMSLGDARRVELWITYVRWFGFAFGAVAIAIQPDNLAPGTESAAWLLLGLLGLGNLILWGALERVRSERTLDRLGSISMGFDTLVVCGLVWVFASEQPYVTWALLFVLPLEAAMRFRLAGAVVAAVGLALFFVPQSVRVAQLTNSDFDLSIYVFVSGLGGLIALTAGTMAEAWHRQSIAFRRQSLRLAEVDRLKDRFLAVTSHEIRGPLAAIIAGVDTVQKRGERLQPHQRQHLLEMVSSQGHQLARLVDDLLLTGELSERQLALHPDWTELEVTIEEAVQAAVTKRRHHQLEMYVEPLRCLIDHARVSQIIRNLVENAYKYTPERTRVAVSAKGVGGGILVEVHDDGPGIPSDKRDQLFDAFHRIDETAAGQDGIGLGLFVVSQLVAAMDGHIDLASSSKGTMFSIHIPCRTIAVESNEIQAIPNTATG